MAASCRSSLAPGFPVGFLGLSVLYELTLGAHLLLAAGYVVMLFAQESVERQLVKAIVGIFTYLFGRVFLILIVLVAAYVLVSLYGRRQSQPADVGSVGSDPEPENGA